MYNTLLRLNRIFAVALSVGVLIALCIPSLAESLSLTAAPVLTGLLAVLAGSVLIDRKLARLAMNESLRSMMNSSGE